MAFGATTGNTGVSLGNLWCQEVRTLQPPSHHRKNRPTAGTHAHIYMHRRAPRGKSEQQNHAIFFIFKIIAFIYFTLGCMGSSQQQGCIQLRLMGSSLQGASLVAELGLRQFTFYGLSSCGSWALKHKLNSCGTRAWWHLGSSRTRSHLCPLHRQADSLRSHQEASECRYSPGLGKHCPISSSTYGLPSREPCGRWAGNFTGDAWRHTASRWSRPTSAA